MRTIRGRTTGFPFPKDGAASLESEEGAARDTVGFRLAVANDYETHAGSGYIFPPKTASSMKVGHNGPSERYATLGIRLVREAE
jgi:hypothetical protein